MPSGTLRKLAPFFTLLSSTVLIGLILSPARPLFPVQKLLTSIGDNPRFTRVCDVYQAYRQRSNCWDPILTILPPDIKTLGFFSHGDDLEAPLWRPLGRRKIISISQEDFDLNNLPSSQAWLARRSVGALIQLNPSWNSNWILGGSISITQKASVGPEEWTLFLLR